jgi:branched-chain amino acid transport system permease protein
MTVPLKVERHTKASRVFLPIAILVVLFGLSVPLWGSSNLMKTAVTFLTLVALAQMWNLLGGYGGMLSVGQQAYIGIAAYALWALAEKAHINPFLAVPIAAVITAAFAVPTAALAFRLRGGYFAVGTWVIAEVYKLIVINTTWLGGGSGVSITSVGKIDRDLREMVVYWLALLVAVGSIAVVYFLLRSRRGLALTAIRDDETGAEGLGVNVFRSKLWVYLIAAFGCGLTGAVIYLNLLRVQPEAAFGLNWSALMIFAVVIGGLGTIEGPIIGAVIFFALQQFLADYGTWYLIILGAIAALVSVFAKRGLWGVVVRRWPVDLFPVRRRLCLETVCFPEEGATPGGGAPTSPGGGSEPADAGPAVSTAEA